MSIRYELIPWDCEGITRRPFPSMDTLLEVAGAIRGPADSVLAWENGHSRPLTAEEQSELRAYVDRRLKQG